MVLPSSLSSHRRTTLLSLTEYRLKRKEMLEWLQGLEGSPKQMTSIYLPPGTLLYEVEKLVACVFTASHAPESLINTLAASPTGGVIFGSQPSGYLIIPPFPINDKLIEPRLNSQPLRDMLSSNLTIAVVLLRLGMYAIGLFRGEQLLTSRVGTGNIHSRHRQGGSSSRRFERHREKQVEEFFNRVCLQARERFDSYLRQIDWVFYGGTKDTLSWFRKQCSYFDQFNDRTVNRRLNIREPKQASLEAAIQDVWTSRVIQWEETLT